MSFWDDVSKGLGTDGSGGGLAGEIDNLGKGLGDAWHQLSSPFVDSELGRMGLTMAGGALGGPWGAAGVNAALGASDASTGHPERNLSNMFRGIGGYYGAGGGGPDMGSGATGLTASAGVGGLEAPLANSSSGIGWGTTSLGGNGASVAFDPNAVNYSLNTGAGASLGSVPTMGQPNYSLSSGYQGSPEMGGGSGVDIQGEQLAPSLNPGAATWQDKLSKFGIDFGKQAVGNTPAGRLAGLAGQGPAAGVPQWLQLARAGTGLYSAYQGNEQAKQNQEAIQTQMRQLSDMYSPNSAYAQQLRQTLARKDAKSGRNSQYGPREAQLQALLAEKAGSIAPGMAQLSTANQSAINAQTAARNTGLNALLSGASAGKSWYDSL